MVTERSESYFSIGILILTALLVALVFWPELNAIVLGISIAVLFQPWYAGLKRALHDRGGTAAAIVVLLAVLIILVPLVLLGLQMFAEAQGLYAEIVSGGGASGVDWFRVAFAQWFPSLTLNLEPYLQQVLGFLISSIGPIFSGFLSVVATLFLSFFALYYFLRDGHRLRTALIERGPLPPEHMTEILDHLHARAGSVIRGSLLIGVLYGLTTGIGFSLFGVSSAVLWGAVTIVASFIPAVGVYLVVIPAVAWLYFTGNVPAAIGLAVWSLAISTIMEAYMRPRLLGGKEKVHPMLMLFAVLGGLSFFGPIGILLGPLALCLLLTLLESYPLFSRSSPART
ncbi:MAG TPA: AI-2E family transporter [Candidatus Paceibacterota bacterium]|nr:AI-2E family transporter [Candidatus Paceibacterota bacterium]